MANTYIATTKDGTEVARFRSSDYDPTGLIEHFGAPLFVLDHTDGDELVAELHAGHYSRLGGTYWCDTCNSPYCDLI